MKHISKKLTPRFRRWSRTGWSVFQSFHRTVSIGVLSVGMSLLLLATDEAQAQTSDSTSIFRSMRIREVGISGSPSSPLRNSLSQTPLFDRSVHHSAPLQTMEDALRTNPSVDIRERGGRGAQADISVRGGSFDQTMILLNGIDFTDARTGHQSHALPLDMEAISGIELIDGTPGVGAYAGAIQIRTAPRQPNYLRLQAQGGSFGEAYAHLSGAATTQKMCLYTALSYRRNDGYRHNTDLENYNAFLRMTVAGDKTGLWEIQAGYQNRSFGSNGFYAAYNPDQWEKTSTILSSVRWSKDIGRLSLGASVGYRKNFDRYDWTRGEAMNRHNTDNISAKIWTDFKSRIGTTSLGGDYAFNHIYSTNLGERLPSKHGEYYTHAKSRHTGNIWLRHLKNWTKFSLSGTIGAAITPYGSRFTWNFSGGYRPTEILKIDAGVWRSMRLPTFTDLYYTSPAQINNLDLEPESATNFRLSFSLDTEHWFTSLRGYYRRGRNIIDWVWREDMGNKWHSEQTNCIDTYGVEWMGGYRSQSGFLRQASISYAYINNTQKGDVVTKSAMDFLRHKATFQLQVQPIRNITLSVTGILSERNGSYTFYPEKGNSAVNELRDYPTTFLLNARLGWQHRKVEIYIEGSNLCDTRQYDLGGILLPGAWFSCGVALTFGR